MLPWRQLRRRFSNNGKKKEERQGQPLLPLLIPGFGLGFSSLSYCQGLIVPLPLTPSRQGREGNMMSSLFCGYPNSRRQGREDWVLLNANAVPSPLTGEG